MKTYPKVKSVKILKDMKLEVIFENYIKKIYDCSNLIQKEPFIQLKNLVLFKNVHADSGGYGILWNDDIDLSESELWAHGENINFG